MDATTRGVRARLRAALAPAMRARDTAAAAADRSGHPDHAARLRAESAALTPHLP